MLRYLIISIILCEAYGVINHIPADFPKCPKDANLDKCAIKATKTLQHRIRNGVKELSLPPIDPFIVPQVELKQESGAIQYTVGLENIVLNGLEEYKFEKLHYDTENYILTGIVSFKKILVHANYDFKGSFFQSPLKSSGVFKGFADETTVPFTFQGQLKRVNGKDYIKSKEASVKLNISNGGGQFDGSVNDNSELSKFTNRLLTENANAILVDACPQISRGVEEVLIQYWEQVFGKLPYDEIFAS